MWFIIGSFCGSRQSKQILKPMLTLLTLGDDPIFHSEISAVETLREKAISVVKRSELWLIWESEGTGVIMCSGQFPALSFKNMLNTDI